MTVDLLNDLLIFGKVSIHITTLIAWLSGVIGLYSNYRQMKRLNNIEDKKDRERALKSLAERCYFKVERITKLSPTKLDDKLLSYMKLAFEAYKDKFNQKPTETEVKELVSHAEKMATENKLKEQK